MAVDELMDEQHTLRHVTILSTASSSRGCREAWDSPSLRMDTMYSMASAVSLFTSMSSALVDLRSRSSSLVRAPATTPPRK